MDDPSSGGEMMLKLIRKLWRPKTAECEWGPLVVLGDYMPIDGVHPVGHRCKVHEWCVRNIRLPTKDDLERIYLATLSSCDGGTGRR